MSVGSSISWDVGNQIVARLPKNPLHPLADINDLRGRAISLGLSISTTHSSLTFKWLDFVQV